MHTQSWSKLVLNGKDTMYRARDGDYVLLSLNQYKLLSINNTVYKIYRTHTFTAFGREITMNYMKGLK